MLEPFKTSWQAVAVGQFMDTEGLVSSIPYKQPSCVCFLKAPFSLGLADKPKANKSDLSQQGLMCVLFLKFQLSGIITCLKELQVGVSFSFSQPVNYLLKTVDARHSL